MRNLIISLLLVSSVVAVAARRDLSALMGEQGPVGATGATGTQGDTGVTGAPAYGPSRVVHTDGTCMCGAGGPGATCRGTCQCGAETVTAPANDTFVDDVGNCGDVMAPLAVVACCARDEVVLGGGCERNTGAARIRFAAPVDGLLTCTAALNNLWNVGQPPSRGYACSYVDSAHNTAAQAWAICARTGQ